MIKLFRDNDIKQCREISEDDLLQGFANSERYLDKSRDEKVRLGLFIAADEPNGLQSTFLGYQFVRLWDYWCANKYRFIKPKAAQKC